MSFRRFPFQFNSANPAERQSELLRRFGVREENSAEISSQSTTNSSGSSPRLQHRLPELFEKKTMKMTAGNVDSMDHQPNVRVIPIQVEGSANECGSKSASPSESQQVANDKVTSTGVNAASDVANGSSQTSAGKCTSRIRNIPVVVENSEEKKLKTKSPKKTVKLSNGPCVSVPKSNVDEESLSVEQRSIHHISEILKEFGAYKYGIEIYSGDEKQYSYLDEMMMRSMLKLDGVETHGNEEIRMARKAAIKEVQCCLDELESKKRKYDAEKCESMSTSSDNINLEGMAKDSEIMDLAEEVKDSKVMNAKDTNSSVNSRELASDAQNNASMVSEADTTKLLDTVVDSPMPEASELDDQNDTEVKCELPLQSAILDDKSSQVVC